MHIRARAYTSCESRQCRYMPLHAQRIVDRAAMPQVHCAKRQCRNMYARQCRNPSHMLAAMPQVRLREAKMPPHVCAAMPQSFADACGIAAFSMKRQCREGIVTNCFAALSGIAAQTYTDGRMDGWTDGRMDGWMDGRMDRRTDGRTGAPRHCRGNICEHVYMELAAACKGRGMLALTAYVSRPDRALRLPVGCVATFGFQ